MNNKYFKLAIANIMALAILVCFNPENLESIEPGEGNGIEVLSDRPCSGYA